MQWGRLRDLLTGEPWVVICEVWGPVLVAFMIQYCYKSTVWRQLGTMVTFAPHVEPHLSMDTKHTQKLIPNSLFEKQLKSKYVLLAFLDMLYAKRSCPSHYKAQPHGYAYFQFLAPQPDTSQSCQITNRGNCVE